MTADIKRVSHTFRGLLDAIKAEVAATEKEIGSAHTEAVDAIGVARTVVREVRNDAAELKALLGVASNNPPPGEGKKWFKS